MLLCGVCLCSVASARRARRVMRGVDELRLEVPKEDGYCMYRIQSDSSYVSVITNK